MTTWQIQIKGIVQGVGFRPFVHHLAESLRVEGHVFNNSNGVTIHFNAPPDQAQIFYHQLITSVPPLSVITDHRLSAIDAQNFTGFVIARSKPSKLGNFRITPDLGMCDACRNEIHDPHNRRFGYAFTTCTHCGPRFSILTGMPFDREHTAMSAFKMCAACLQEYGSPQNSRHHAQTNSCSECGITLKLFDSRIDTYVGTETDQEVIKIIGRHIMQGSIVAVKGIGGYLLICDATNSQTLIELRRRKQRPRKPLALMYPNIKAVRHDYRVSDQEGSALQSSAAPIVLLQPKSEQHIALASDQINPGLDRVGVMLPYAPLFEQILQHVQSPLVATSGNTRQSPIVHDDETAIKKLSAIADYIVTHNRAIIFSQDDSVLQFTKNAQQGIILRRSRGFAPNYINSNIKFSQDTEISMGADLKSAFGLVHHQSVLISQYLGDMGNYEVQENAMKYITWFKNLLQQPVGKIVVDKHPNYCSRQLGIDLSQEDNIPVLEVQHHVAHFYALLGEHNLVDTQEKILGVIWDGTGYGDDGHIWGSEYFIFQNQKMSRVCHIKCFDVLAGDKLSQEPKLSALVIGFGHNETHKRLQKKFTAEEWRIYTRQVASGIQLQSSSMGRLFDAVASLLDVTDINTFESEAAMSLQTLASDYLYSQDLPTLKPYAVLDPQLKLDGGLLMSEMCKDLDAGRERKEIAARFYQTLVYWIEQVARAQQVNTLAFSGGVFQNPVLVDLISKQLEGHFELLFHKDFSANDENIAFGQLVYSSLLNKVKIRSVN